MTKKSAKNAEENEKLLTETELELMTILWRLSEGNVAEVIANLPKGRDLAYTSVSTILRILEQKNVVSARKEGRGHIYVPTITKADYEIRSVRSLVKRVFDDTPSALVKQLVNAIPLDSAELAELKKIIEDAGKRK